MVAVCWRALIFQNNLGRPIYTPPPSSLIRYDLFSGLAIKKIKTSTSIDFPLPDFPFEIISHILALLPVQDLAIFRTVCQSWRDHIDSPSFISKHRNLYNKQHSKNTHLLIQETHDLPPKRYCLYLVTNGQKLTTLPLFPPLHNHNLIAWSDGGCNGLFLMDCNSLSDNYRCLWNPFLRKALILPNCPFVTPNQFTHYVLGFSPTYDDYKVLVYRLKGYEYEPAMAVYSLRNHVWTIKNNPMNVDAWTLLKPPEAWINYVYCGCVVYWFSKGDSGIIYSFDFDTEEFNNVAVPEPLKEGKNLFLFTIGELLAVMSSSCILVMEKHDGEFTWREWCSESWIKDFFDMLEEIRFEHLFQYSPTIFFLEQNRTFLIIWFWSGVQFYEVTSQRLEMLADRRIDFRFYGPYVETLALITGTEGMVFKRHPELM